MSELDEFRSKVHDGITTCDLDGRQVPCIMVDARQYDELFAKIGGGSFSIRADLDVFEDGLGHVFVKIVLEFLNGGAVKEFWLDAQADMRFFECMEAAGMLVLSSPGSRHGESGMLAIQLPSIGRIRHAVQKIRDGLVPRNGAVTGI